MTRSLIIPLLLLGLVASLPAHAQGSAAGLLKQMDADGDGRIGKGEWQKKAKGFKRLDTNGDGYLSLDELEARFGGGGESGAEGSGNRQPAQLPDAANVRLEGAVGPDAVDPTTKCAILRGRKCDIGDAIRRGLAETGLRPRFPDGLDCRGIDEAWAIDYSGKRDRENYHGGIDMPAPYGTPMLAAADGTVVSVSNDPRSYRGIELILRHTPEETGLPVWTYTQYAHLDSEPAVKVGDRVKLGQDLGPTGNSGFSNGRRTRRPAIHFAAWYSDKPGFFTNGRGIAPVDGWWMDPLALYRGRQPVDTRSLQALPSAEKAVSIAVITDSGEVVPAGAKLIWPYSCKRD